MNFNVSKVKFIALVTNVSFANSDQRRQSHIQFTVQRVTYPSTIVPCASIIRKPIYQIKVQFTNFRRRQHRITVQRVFQVNNNTVVRQYQKVLRYLIFSTSSQVQFTNFRVCGQHHISFTVQIVIH